MASATTRPAITDSPWFWLCLFCTFALLALAVMERKFSQRQAQIERQYQGRQRAAQQRAGQEPTTPMSSSERTIITLRPLLIIFALVLLVAWIAFWQKHLNRT